MSKNTKGIAALLAAHGRNGDTELVHATKGEIAALNRIKRGIDGKGLPRNPKTGLTEANFFNQYVVPVLPAVAGLAAGALTGGTMAAPAAALAGAATGAGTKAIQGGSTQDVLLGGGLGAISGYGAGTLGAGLAEAGTGAATAATPGATTAVVPPVDAGAGLGGANAFTGTPAPLGGAEQGFGSFGGANPSTSNLFTSSVQDGANLYNAGAPAVTATPTPISGEASLANASGQGQAQGQAAIRAMPNLTQNTPGPAYQTLPNASTPTPAATPEVPQYASKTEFLKSDAAAGAVPKVAMGTLGIASLNQGDLSGTTTEEVDKTLPKSEVYYTDTGERRTRIVDRPQYGNVNMARGGDVYGDYEGVDEAADGGYRPGGGLNYAGGGLAGTGWGEQTRGGFSGLTESLQPGGAFGEWHGKVYGALGADQIMPGGAMGSLVPGANQYNAKKREEEEKKRAEQEAGIAAAAKAKQEAEFKQKWDERYTQGMADGGNVVYTSPNQVGQYRGEAFRDDQGTLRTRAVDMTPKPEEGLDGLFGGLFGGRRRREDEDNAAMYALLAKLGGKKMADGGIANLGHYSDGGSLLRGPGDGVSDSIPASIEGKRPARLADGEFVVPARAVSELGNGSTEAGSKQLYAMLDRIAKKRKSGKGLAYQANPKKILPA